MWVAALALFGARVAVGASAVVIFSAAMRVVAQVAGQWAAVVPRDVARVAVDAAALAVFSGAMRVVAAGLRLSAQAVTVGGAAVVGVRGSPEPGMSWSRLKPLLQGAGVAPPRWRWRSRLTSLLQRVARHVVIGWRRGLADSGSRLKPLLQDWEVALPPWRWRSRLTSLLQKGGVSVRTERE